VGTHLPVEALIGYILADGEPPPTGTPAKDAATPTSSAAPAATDAPSRPPGGAPSSPIARRLAAQHGIDISRLRGSGPGGRIVEADVMAAVSDAASSKGVDAVVPPAGGRHEIALTGMRRSIADRLRHSLATAVSITITREIRADALVESRKKLTGVLGADVSYDALFIKLFAAALQEYPAFNSTIERDTIVVLDRVHIGFAVALPEGLIVPVVHEADSSSLQHVSSTVRELSERALGGRLRPADVTGGTASISNLGHFGVEAFTPILNPPQSAILGIGRIVERPVVDAGKIIPAPVCMLSLTFDHRVADGMPASQLLDSIARKMNDERYLAGFSS
jgi:pyruvate dehydrogenase E2 component (dihydrolipoamide acetyltransferase)